MSGNYSFPYVLGGGSGGAGTVTTVSVVTANGVSGVVANPTTAPAITLSLSGVAPSAITGTAAILGANTFTGAQIGLSFQTTAGNSTPAFFVGGTTSSFPALRRGNTELQVVLADNSAYADLRANNVTAGSSVVVGSGGFVLLTDAYLARSAAGVLEANTGTIGTYGTFISKTHSTAPSSANGQSMALTTLTELTTIAAAATTATAIQIPAGAIVFGCSVRVVTAIPTAATFTVTTTSGATTLNTVAVTVAAGSTDAGTKAGAFYQAAASTITITPNLTPGAATGQVRVTVYYMLSTPPTS